MLQSLIVLDNDTDALWLRHAIGVDSPKLVVKLDKDSNDHKQPHYNDGIGWRRWLMQRQIETIYCYQPTGNFYGLLAAAAALDVTIIFYLTGHISHRLQSTLNLSRLRRGLYRRHPGGNCSFSRQDAGDTNTNSYTIKLFNKRINTFLCAGDFIAGQLRQIGIDADRISVDVPRVDTTSVQTISESRRLELRRRTGGGFVLLALSRPSDRQSLKLVVWAASMLKHIYSDLKLVVSGTCRPSERDCLRQWENALDSEELIYFDEDSTDWVELAGNCDVVITGGTPLDEVIRLLYARAAGTPIVAGTGQANEYLRDYGLGKIVTPAKPRHLAGAILSLLEKNTS